MTLLLKHAPTPPSFSYAIIPQCLVSLLPLIWSPVLRWKWPQPIWIDLPIDVVQKGEPTHGVLWHLPPFGKIHNMPSARNKTWQVGMPVALWGYLARLWDVCHSGDVSYGPSLLKMCHCVYPPHNLMKFLMPLLLFIPWVFFCCPLNLMKLVVALRICHQGDNKIGVLGGKWWKGNRDLGGESYQGFRIILGINLMG